MGNKQYIRPLSPEERKYASDNYHLITEFLKRSKLDAEEFFDVVVFEFLLSVEIYLNNTELQKRCNFEEVSYMHMKRAVYRHFREQKTMKRSSAAGADISFEEIEDYVGESVYSMSNEESLEYRETVQRIEVLLTEEQRKIFVEKLDGYSLKEIADNNGINAKRVYKQFGRIKNIVGAVMEA